MSSTSTLCAAAPLMSAAARTPASLPSARRESAPADLFRERAFEQGRGRNHRPRKERRVPVDHDALRLVQHLRRHRLPAIALREPGETLDDVHPSPSEHDAGREADEPIRPVFPRVLQRRL